MMGGTAFIIMLLSGLCTLPSCFPRQYHLVKEKKTWTEAQSYCRQKYTDLATEDSDEDVAKLHHVLGPHQGRVWIGLYNDINSWRWSLGNESFYGEGEAEFRVWGSTQPNNYNNNENCAMFYRGKWVDAACSTRCSFICYNAQGPPRFIWVREHKTWAEARSYCREKYTDLASVRNQTENQEIQSLISSGEHAWIGLFRGVWKWSDGSTRTNWDIPREPYEQNSACMAKGPGDWAMLSCNERLYFLCYSADPQWTWRKLSCGEGSNFVQIVQLHLRLTDQGLSDVKLRWVTQPDGKVFHKEEEEEEEESCGSN